LELNVTTKSEEQTATTPEEETDATGLRKMLTLLNPLHPLVMGVPNHKGHQPVELL